MYCRRAGKLDDEVFPVEAKRSKKIIVMTLGYELKRRGGGYGVCGICSGHAQGDAMLIRVD